MYKLTIGFGSAEIAIVLVHHQIAEIITPPESFGTAFTIVVFAVFTPKHRASDWLLSNPLDNSVNDHAEEDVTEGQLEPFQDFEKGGARY